MSKPISTIEVCASLIAEHRQMEKLLEAFERELNALDSGKILVKADRQRLDAAMAPVAYEMDVHFACEEEVLFPAVDPYHPMVLMEVGMRN